MPVDQLMNLMATSLGALGSVYVLKSFLALSPAVAVRLAQSYYDTSREHLVSLANQRADSVVGAGAISIAFLIAFINAAIGPSRCAIDSRWVGAVIVLVFLGIAIVSLVKLSRAISSGFVSEASRLIS